MIHWNTTQKISLSNFTWNWETFNVSFVTSALKNKGIQNIQGVPKEMLLKSIFMFLTLGGVFLRITRWTFFRVKLVFQFDFKISWSLGPWDSWTPSLYILLPPPVSFSYSPPLAWFGMVLVWFGMGGWVVTFEIEVGDGLLTFILMLRS